MSRWLRQRFGQGAEAKALPLQARLTPVAALERSDNVADRSHAFAVLKRG